MACVSVGYSGEEFVFVNKPHRRISKNEFYFDENDKCNRRQTEST